MATAKAGDTVHIHYTGRLTDGTVFDSSEGSDPLQFTLGSGQVIPGFDAGVTGMAPGEQKTIEIPAAKAYGEARPEMVFQVPREQFPDGYVPQVGEALEVGLQTGGAIPVTVKAVDDEGVTLDANHPLAGQDLIFDLELVEIG